MITLTEHAADRRIDETWLATEFEGVDLDTMSTLLVTGDVTGSEQKGDTVALTLDNVRVASAVESDRSDIHYADLGRKVRMIVDASDAEGLPGDVRVMVLACRVATPPEEADASDPLQRKPLSAFIVQFAGHCWMRGDIMGVHTA